MLGPQVVNFRFFRLSDIFENNGGSSLWVDDCYMNLGSNALGSGLLIDNTELGKVLCLAFGNRAPEVTLLHFPGPPREFELEIASLDTLVKFTSKILKNDRIS